MMLRGKSTVAALSILVAVATAHPYGNNAEWNYRWNDLFAARGQEVGARVRNQAQATVELSSCATVTYTEKGNGKSYRVRVCTADPEDSSKVCLATRVSPCCQDTKFSLGNPVSNNTVSIDGEAVRVTYYLANRELVCFRLDNHPTAKSCSESISLGISRSCLPPCADFPNCFNNTLSGDGSSCDGSTCQCKAGYLPPDCCQCDKNNFYESGPGPICTRFCRNNCNGFRPTNPGPGGCALCNPGFIGAPECCECEPGKTEVDGVCKCDANRNPDGTCAKGALESDCCECDPVGNATHAFYKDVDGKCKPYCKNNCAGSVGLGCSTCKPGFMSPPECCQCVPGRDEVAGVCKCRANLNPDGSCIPEAKPEDCCECNTGYQRDPITEKCEPERCDKQQQLFFYIDATSSNSYDNFCSLVIVVQMLVAAFNPSSTSGTRITTLLFSDNSRNKEPSLVFDMNSPCSDAVQGSNRSLSSLIIDFGKCTDDRNGYTSSIFPSSCGEGTSAVKGLQKIHSLVSNSGKSSSEVAIVMLTDGIIVDNSSERQNVLNDLKSATLIAAGINKADRSNLRNYASNENILVGNQAVQLGIDIVNLMQERGIICEEHADNITLSLRNVLAAQEGRLIEDFCECHRTDSIDRKDDMGRNICQRKYPTCGGSLSIGLPILYPSSRAKIQHDEEYVNQLLMEEEILAAVEKVLEQHHG